MLRWTRKPPNKDGIWLRLNAGGRIQRHWVEGGLIDWGWGGESRMIPLANPKLRGWLWYGPIPRPPDEERYAPDLAPAPAGEEEYKDEV